MGVVRIRSVLFCAAGLAVTACAAAEGTIDLQLPYNIAYDLAPIHIVLGVKNCMQPDIELNYHVYDLYKHEIAKGTLRLRTQNGAAQQIVSFTPPKFGWYAVQLFAAGEQLGWQQHVGVTPRYPNMHALAAGEVKNGWNDEAYQAFSGLLLDRTNTNDKNRAEQAVQNAQA